MPASADTAALGAIRSWYRLDRAFAAFNAHLRERHGVTGVQLALLRILAEAPLTLAALRRRLVMHPATLGQLVDRLEGLGLAATEPDLADRRRRLVKVTPAGYKMLAVAPVAGPVRLRSHHAEPDRLLRLAEAFDDAVALFGLEEWAA